MNAAAVSTIKPSPEENLATVYLASADRVLDAYRTSPDPWLYKFDWPKAEIYLERAVQLGAGDDRTQAKLALVRGYALLERLGGAQYSENAAGLLRIQARDEFLLASLKAPTDPAPHLALARVYTYSLPDPAKMMAEFATAEHLGAVLGRREIEQQGDGYRIFAQQELAHNWRQATRDAQVARAFYRKVAGFGEVDQHMRDLRRIHAPVRKPRTWRSYRWR